MGSSQGRIEEDTFVRDLVMMMSDIEEIKRIQSKIKLRIKELNSIYIHQ